MYLFFRRRGDIRDMTTAVNALRVFTMYTLLAGTFLKASDAR